MELPVDLCRALDSRSSEPGVFVSRVIVALLRFVTSRVSRRHPVSRLWRNPTELASTIAINSAQVNLEASVKQILPRLSVLLGPSPVALSRADGRTGWRLEHVSPVTRSLVTQT